MSYRTYYSGTCQYGDAAHEGDCRCCVQYVGGLEDVSCACEAHVADFISEVSWNHSQGMTVAGASILHGEGPWGEWLALP